MTFSEWFRTQYQRPGEAKFNAIHRLAMELKIGWTTVMRAVNGSRVQNASAAMLAGVTNGAVDPETLKNAPTRPQLKPTKPSSESGEHPAVDAEPASEARS